LFPVNVSPTPIAGSAAEDHALSRALLDRVAAGQLDSALRIWAPVRALALSRLDMLRAGAAAASAAGERAGFAPIRRVSGGHAVVLGSGSLCVGFAEPAVSFEGTQERYERLSAAIVAALAELGVEAERGALTGEWCPGAWSIRSGAVKLAGLAQRAIKGGAWVEAVVELGPDTDARSLLTEVYAALELPLDPATVGSVSEVLGETVGFTELADALLRNVERRP
jgi:lipoate-protein ligase A